MYFDSKGLYLLFFFFVDNSIEENYVLNVVDQALFFQGDRFRQVVTLHKDCRHLGLVYASINRCFVHRIVEPYQSCALNIDREHCCVPFPSVLCPKSTESPFLSVFLNINYRAQVKCNTSLCNRFILLIDLSPSLPFVLAEGSIWIFATTCQPRFVWPLFNMVLETSQKCIVRLRLIQRKVIEVVVEFLGSVYIYEFFGIPRLGWFVSPLGVHSSADDSVTLS